MLTLALLFLGLKKKSGGKDDVYIKICKQVFITNVFITEVQRSIHSQTSKSSNIHGLVWQTTVTPDGTATTEEQISHAHMCGWFPEAVY